MVISLIAALAADRVIGKGNAIPWHLSADVAWFKRHTFNKPLIMGRKTFTSIGKPLPDRLNIVLSSHPDPGNETGVMWAKLPAQAVSLVGKHEKEIMVIGGSKVYKTYLAQAKRLYLTHINVKIDGDTWFPYYKPDEWRSTFNEFHNSDSKNVYSYSFEILERN